MRESKGGKVEGPVGSVAGGVGCGQAPSQPPVESQPAGRRCASCSLSLLVCLLGKITTLLGPGIQG